MKHAALVLVAITLPAHAQFKCTAADGAVAFQQAPCSGSERSEALVLPASSPESERPYAIRWALANRRIIAGMTRDEIRRVTLAEPDHVNVTVAAGGRSEQHVYRRPGATVYVYLDNGVVSAVQSFER